MKTLWIREDGEITDSGDPTAFEYVPADVAQRLYDTLERVLNSGDWFGSALEFTGDDDLLGDQLEEVVRDALAAADGEEV